MHKVLDTYTREHNLAVRELNMQHWATKDPRLVEHLQSLLRQQKDTNQIHCAKGQCVGMRLQGEYSTKTICSLRGVTVSCNI